VFNIKTGPTLGSFKSLVFLMLRVKYLVLHMISRKHHAVLAIEVDRQEADWKILH
jgi:hypothetical protein